MLSQDHSATANWGIGSAWIHRFALLTSASTLVLIFVGGLVTNTGSGLAVPDWPTTFGYHMFSYPWSRMVGGILYEHSHRLIGSLVGLLTLTLAILIWFGEPRRSIRWLGATALSAVIIQGVLGGLRVLWLSIGPWLAVIHGCLAQAFFALTIGLAVVTSREWIVRPDRDGTADAGAVRRLCLLTTILVYAQIVSGAMLTHTGNLFRAHLVFAALVAIHVPLLAVRIMRYHADRPRLVRLVAVLSGLLVVQLLLGIGAYAWRFGFLGSQQAPVIGLALPTTHRVTGALMLAICTVLALRTHRLLALPARLASGKLISEQARA